MSRYPGGDCGECVEGAGEGVGEVGHQGGRSVLSVVPVLCVRWRWLLQAMGEGCLVGLGSFLRRVALSTAP